MPHVLFVCFENACRSQMAEAFARQLGPGILEAFSAGSRPAGAVNAEAVRVMAEVGIDISGYQSKGFLALPVKEFGWVIMMGCGDRCPFVPAKNILYWDIEDPKGRNRDFFRKVRDKIKNNVASLIQQMTVAQ